VSDSIGRYHRQGRILLALSFVCAVESALAVVWLARMPTDPKNIWVAGLSAQRLITMFGILLVGLGFLGVGILSLRSRGTLAAQISQSRRAITLTSVVLAFAVAGSWFLIILPPPSLILRPSALWDRSLPVLLWVGLMSSQSLLFVALIAFQRLREWVTWLRGRITRWIAQPIAGYSLLALSVLISLTQVYYVHYNIGDEGDTFAVGWLVARGWTLYTDVFSHHFPFPYLWVAAVVKLFGASVLAVRLSLVALRMVVFAIAMRTTRYFFALGLTALAWSILGHLYLGNGLLYQSFSGAFALGAFAIGFAIVQGDVNPRRRELFAIGVLSGLAVMSDPLKALPAAVLVIFLGLSAVHLEPMKEKVRGGFARSGVVLAGLLAAVLAVLALIWMRGGIADFYRSAIQFNAEIYSKYAQPITFKDALKPMLSFLDVFSPQWRVYTSPHFEWTTYDNLDAWVFTGLFFRASIVLGAVVLLTKRGFLPALFLYFFGATMLVRAERYFHASPFVLFSLFCSSLMISGCFGRSNSAERLDQAAAPGPQWRASVRAGVLLIWWVVTAAFGWLNIRGAGHLVGIRSKLTYDANFGALQGNAGFLNEATCHLDQARVLVYPSDPMQYFLAEIPPASKYHFMTPWVAEIGQAATISQLGDGQFLVHVDRGWNIWGHPVEVYMAELLAYLDEHYIQIDPSDFLSPQLAQACPPGSAAADD